MISRFMWVYAVFLVLLVYFVYLVCFVIARNEVTKPSQKNISNEDCHTSRGSVRNDSFSIF